MDNLHRIASRWPRVFVGLVFVYIWLLAPQVKLSHLPTNLPQNLRPTGRNVVYVMAMRKWESCKLSCRIFPKSMNNILNIYNSRHWVVFKFDEENIPAVPILLKFSLWKLLKILSSSTWKNNLFTGPAEAMGFNYPLKLFLRLLQNVDWGKRLCRTRQMR